MYKDIIGAIRHEHCCARENEVSAERDLDENDKQRHMNYAKEHYQVEEWLKELKELRELKDTYAKGMEASYSEFRYQQGRAEGYSKAENDYFAQSQKDREDTYNCGYAIGRQDAEEEVENRFNRVLDDEKRISYQQGRQDAEKELNALGECEYNKGRQDTLEPIIKFIDDYDGAICISESMGVINGQQLINELKEIVEQLKEKK